MPLKLVPPRAGKTPFWYVRGTYLSVAVDRSTKASERRVAAKILAQIKDDIERGHFARPAEPTFLSAAVAYMKAGREKRFVQPLLDHFKERALSSIDQGAIDEAAVTLYPTATPATRNRQVYSVVSAILKHAGIDHKLKRPKGARGVQKTDWLWPEQAFRLFKAADSIDPEFGLFLRVLCYTGMRLSEALSLRCDDVRLSERFAFVADTKNGQPRPVFLPPELVVRLGAHPRGCSRGSARLFRFTKSGRLYTLLRLSRERMDRRESAAAADGHLAASDGSSLSFHTFRHTWATWMRRYAGLDTRGLVGTGAWRDRTSAARYEHVVVSEEAMKASLLPVENGR